MPFDGVRGVRGVMYYPSPAFTSEVCLEVARRFHEKGYRAHWLHNMNGGLHGLEVTKYETGHDIKF